MVDGINTERLTAWLSEQIPELVPPVKFSLITGGNSNLTYRCDDSSGSSYVLRRPPLGHVLESAHDMAREYRIIEALKGSGVPVPYSYGLCRDQSVNDCDFYVMRYLDGLVLNDSAASEILTSSERMCVSQDVVDILCRLHAINPDELGLGDLGRKGTYLERQLKRWDKQWEASKTHEISAMEESSRLLKERIPQQLGVAIVHGDYRLGNMIVRDGNVQAVLDWELCTLGDPLADVGYLLNDWVSADEVNELGANDMSPTAAGGFFSREQLKSQYEQKTGRDLTGINYYRAFSHWRTAAIGQGVYKRYLVGAMGENRDVDVERLKQGVQRRAESALELLVGEQTR